MLGSMRLLIMRMRLLELKSLDDNLDDNEEF
jgi:hypothetical protein